MLIHVPGKGYEEGVWVIRREHLKTGNREYLRVTSHGGLIWGNMLRLATRWDSRLWTLSIMCGWKMSEHPDEEGRIHRAVRLTLKNRTVNR